MRTSPEVGECDLLRGDRCAVDGVSSSRAEVGLRLSQDAVGGISLLIKTVPVLCVGFEEVQSDERYPSVMLEEKCEGRGELE